MGFVKDAVGSIGGALGGLAKTALPAAASFIPGVGPVASGALGGLLNSSGGIGNRLASAGIGALGGAAGQQAGLDPTLTSGIIGLGTGALDEQRRAREAAEAQINARQDLLTRNLGLAEQSFAERAPLREQGTAALSGFLGGGNTQGIFARRPEGVAAGTIPGVGFSPRPGG